MKKILSIFVVGFLLVPSSPSFAATKTCTKKEINVIKSGQICVKSGTKYIWKKYTKPVVIVPTPTPTPTSTPTPTPTPTSTPTPTPTPVVVIEKSKTEQDFDAITKLSEDSSLNTGFKATTIVSDQILPQTTEHIVAKYDKAYNFWSHYVTGLKNITLIIGTGDNVRWLADQIEKFIGHPDDLFYQSNVDAVNREPCQNFGAGSLFLLTDIYVNTYRLYPKQCSIQEPNKQEYVGAPFHEFTHNMQTTLAGDARLLPCWMKEGQATFYENNLGNAGNFAEFTRVKKVWVSRTDKSMIIPTLKKLDVGYGDGNCSRDGGYEYGYTAMQVLADQYGQDKGIDLLKEIKITKDWKIAFEHTYGKTFDAWLLDSKKELESL